MDPSLSLIVREYHADARRRHWARLGFDRLDPRLLDDIGADDRQRWAATRRLRGWLAVVRRHTLTSLVLPQSRSARRA